VRRYHLHPDEAELLYLVAITDWHSRKVLAWHISNTQEADVCVEALNEAIQRFGAPAIMTTDQGSKFTSFVWTDRLKLKGTRISMDGKGRCIDNVFIERLAVTEVCMRLSERLGRRLAGQGRHRKLYRLLQQPPPAFIVRRRPTRPVLSPGNQQNPTRSASAKSSLTYPRNRSRFGERLNGDVLGC
jgi:Integrase core domain